MIVRLEHVSYGGKILIFGGDFRQTLPTLRHGSEHQIIGACIKRSMLWNNIHVIKLKTNMRITGAANQEEAKAFADFLLRVGEGREPTTDGKIRLPDSIVSWEKTVNEFVDTKLVRKETMLVIGIILQNTLF